MNDYVKDYLGAELLRLKSQLTPLEKEATQLAQQLATKQATVAEYQEKIKAIEAVLGPSRDRRAVNWQDGYAFRAMSQSDGPDHEIVAGRNTKSQYRSKSSELYDWSCNCEANVFGKDCWALTAAKNWIDRGGALPYGIKRVTAKASPFFDPSIEMVGSTFGAPRAKLRTQ